MPEGRVECLELQLALCLGSRGLATWQPEAQLTLDTAMVGRDIEMAELDAVIGGGCGGGCGCGGYGCGDAVFSRRGAGKVHGQLTGELTDRQARLVDGGRLPVVQLEAAMKTGGRVGLEVCVQAQVGFGECLMKTPRIEMPGAELDVAQLLRIKRRQQQRAGEMEIVAGWGLGCGWLGCGWLGCGGQWAGFVWATLHIQLEALESAFQLPCYGQRRQPAVSLLHGLGEQLGLGRDSKGGLAIQFCRGTEAMALPAGLGQGQAVVLAIAEQCGLELTGQGRAVGLLGVEVGDAEPVDLHAQWQAQILWQLQRAAAGAGELQAFDGQLGDVQALLQEFAWLPGQAQLVQLEWRRAGFEAQAESLDLQGPQEPAADAMELQVAAAGTAQPLRRLLGAAVGHQQPVAASAKQQQQDQHSGRQPGQDAPQTPGSVPGLGRGAGGRSEVFHEIQNAIDRAKCRRQPLPCWPRARSSARGPAGLFQRAPRP